MRRLKDNTWFPVECRKMSHCLFDSQLRVHVCSLPLLIIHCHGPSNWQVAKDNMKSNRSIMSYILCWQNVIIFYICFSLSNSFCPKRNLKDATADMNEPWFSETALKLTKGINKGVPNNRMLWVPQKLGGMCILTSWLVFPVGRSSSHLGFHYYG